MIKKIDHIGIAVKSIEKTGELFSNILGLKVAGEEIIEEQKVKVAFLPLGDSELELLESTSLDGPIARFIEKKGEGIHHIAFAVTDADEALKNAKENGIRLIDRISRKGAEGMDIGFLNPRSTNGVLIEFCSK